MFHYRYLENITEYDIYIYLEITCVSSSSVQVYPRFEMKRVEQGVLLPRAGGGGIADAWKKTKIFSCSFKSTPYQRMFSIQFDIDKSASKSHEINITDQRPHICYTCKYSIFCFLGSSNNNLLNDNFFQYDSCEFNVLNRCLHKLDRKISTIIIIMQGLPIYFVGCQM